MTINDVVESFIKNGYQVTKTEYCYLVKDEYLEGFIIEPPQRIHGIFLDRKDCFDKWSKCPIQVPIPIDEGQFNQILKKIEWLKTDDGYKASNEYEREKWMDKYELCYFTNEIELQDASQWDCAINCLDCRFKGGNADPFSGFKEQ